MTGIVFSNIMLAALPVAFDSKTIYVSPNAGALADRRQGLQPVLLRRRLAERRATTRRPASTPPSAGYQERLPDRAQLPGRQGLAHRLQALLQGQGRRRDLHQARPARLRRRARADPRRQARRALHLPARRHGHQLHQAVRRRGPVARTCRCWCRASPPTRTSSAPVGEPMLGLFNTSHWAHDLDNAANRKFVAAFEKEYKRLPSVYAAQGYDTALLIDAAVRDVKGKIEDDEAVRKALKAAKLRVGARRVQVQQQPVPDPELLPARGRQGRQGPPGQQDAATDLQGPRRRLRARPAR